MGKGFKYSSVEQIFNIQMEHGEGPIWDNVTKSFYWVDLLQGDFHKGDLSTKKTEKVNIGQALGVIGLHTANQFILATRDGFGTFDSKSKTFKLINPIPETLDPQVRFNDGVMGPDGKFYAGTMNWEGKEGYGKFFRFNSDGRYDILEQNHCIPNGMGWNMKMDTFFMIDTGHHCIYSFNYIKDSGQLQDKKVFKQFGSNEHPDGMAIDSQNHFWIAMWGSSKIIHLDEKGMFVEEIPLPVKYPTSCCFGGEQLNLLFITSSRLLLNEAERVRDTLSGNNFILETSHRAQKEYRFATSIFKS